MTLQTSRHLMRANFVLRPDSSFGVTEDRARMAAQAPTRRRQHPPRFPTSIFTVTDVPNSPTGRLSVNLPLPQPSIGLAIKTQSSMHPTTKNNIIHSFCVAGGPSSTHLEKDSLPHCLPLRHESLPKASDPPTFQKAARPTPTNPHWILQRNTLLNEGRKGTNKDYRHSTHPP